MKKLSLILILAPIFLISSLNFYGGASDINHTEASRAFTCTSCHASIIDGIIIGKEEGDINFEFVDFEISIPTGVPYSGVALNVNSSIGMSEYFLNGKPPFLNDEYGQLFTLDLSSNLKGKKENTIKIKYPISDLDIENGSIEIQGVLSNLDGQLSGDYSFYKKIDLTPTQKEISIFPSVSNDIVNINNLPTNALIQIFNSTGQIVYNQKAQSLKETLNVSEFQKGNYFVLIQNGKEVSQSKFIVSK